MRRHMRKIRSFSAVLGSWFLVLAFSSRHSKGILSLGFFYGSLPCYIAASSFIGLSLHFPDDQLIYYMCSDEFALFRVLGIH